MLDQLEVELHRMELINTILAQGTEIYGDDFRQRINEGVREMRGVGIRPVETVVVRPSEDVGTMAARAWEKTGGIRALGFLAGTLTSLAHVGVPEGEAACSPICCSTAATPEICSSSAAPTSPPTSTT